MNKKGSASIFLLLILASIISLVFLFIEVAEKSASVGYADGILNLAGRSVLSEFNKDLKDDYGLIAFRGYDYDISKKINEYAGYSFDENNKLNLENIDVDNSKYSMANVNAMENEIIDYSKFLVARNLLEKDEESKNTILRKSEKVLRSERVINDLPSKDLGKNPNIVTAITENLKKLDNVLEESSDEFFIGKYIMNTFKNLQDSKASKKTFFDFEGEYILYGSLKDDSNRKKFKRDVKLVRNVINLVFIYTDSKKRNEVMAAAQLITPGPEAVLTQIALSEAWALAEANNDMEILEHGKKVPLKKNNDTWAVDLDTIIDNKKSEYIDTNSKTGMTYRNYLEIFLFFRDKDYKVARIMDLIQINMQGNHDKTFLVKEHSFGFNFSTKVNKRRFTYDEKY